MYTADRILTAIDQKKTSAVVLLDMSKAFDSVNHDILLKKLQDIGLSPSAILWFKSYLSNRYQAVRINTALSKPLPMRYGVPQGSITHSFTHSFIFAFNKKYNNSIQKYIKMYNIPTKLLQDQNVVKTRKPI